MKDKKIAAIMAAINAYLDEETALAVAVPQRPAAMVSLWQVSGRQEIMQMRALWQRRIVPR